MTMYEIYESKLYNIPYPSARDLIEDRIRCFEMDIRNAERRIENAHETISADTNRIQRAQVYLQELRDALGAIAGGTRESDAA
jgi:hypothetical protein